MPRPTHPVLGFQHRDDAERFLEQLRERLGKFGLELNSEKTRKRHAVRKMKVGPSEPLCRGRLQTAVSCFSQKLRW